MLRIHFYVRKFFRVRGFIGRTAAAAAVSLLRCYSCESNVVDRIIKIMIPSRLGWEIMRRYPTNAALTKKKKFKNIGCC